VGREENLLLVFLAFHRPAFSTARQALLGSIDSRLSIQPSLAFPGPAFCRSFHHVMTIGRRSGAKPCERSEAEAALSREMGSENFLVFLPLLGLSWRTKGEYKAVDEQMCPAGNRKYRVLPIVLGTGEALPTLVRTGNWIPVRVATRWAVRRRRFECMDSTLAHDLRALALLYEWAETTLRCDLDDLLETFVVPEGRQLDSLVTFLRVKASRVSSNSFNSLPTVANQALAIRSFLMWAADPANQGSVRPKCTKQIAEERAMLIEMFRPFARYTGAAQRIAPLSQSDLGRIKQVIGPHRHIDGRLVLPLGFDEQNPFRLGSRLRNWLMCAIAYQCGLRRGELLKIRLDDLPKPNDPGIKIRRRPHDRADVRRHKPRVKTVERVLPISDEIRAGLRAYLASPVQIGRPAGRTPYLFVSAGGAPLSIAAADGIVKIMGRHTGVEKLSWHSFRHTWAESLADDLLGEYHEEQALAFIRELGGWKSNSATPMHYIQNALAKRAAAFLQARNDRLYAAPEITHEL
jgi:integrase